eukprot:7949005-Alexandrium_andersonii.AAC.1
MERALLSEGIAYGGRRCEAAAFLKFIWSSLEGEYVQKLLREGRAEGVLEALRTLLPLAKTQLE